MSCAVTSVASPPQKYSSGSSLSAIPTLATIVGAMKGMTEKPANIRAIMNAKARK